jgi:Gas vesicle synthesis protein GvpL/GvpF
MSESPAAAQVWCVQVHVDPGADGTGGPAAASGVPQDDLFPLEPHWRLAGARAEEIDQALTEIAIVTWRQLTLCPPLIGSGGRLLLSGSYLVSAEETGDFPGIAAQLTSRHPSLRVRTTGPWPPGSRPGVAQITAGARGPG